MDKHGGAIDPFALSFEGPDGVPTQARHNTPSETSMHSTQASPSTPSRSANQRYSVQEEIPVGPPQSKTSTRYRNPDPTYQEHIGAPTHPPQPAQPIPSAPARVENQTYGAQSGAPIASARPAPPTPYRSLEQIPWEPVYPRQSPVSTPAGSVNSISRVPVGTRTSYLPKVQAAVSVAEVRSPAATHTGYEPVSKIQNHGIIGMQEVDLEGANEKDTANDNLVRLTRTPLRGYLGNFFTKRSKYRAIQSPHSVQEAGLKPDHSKTFRHRDGLGRIYEGPPDDRFLNPLDGTVKELVVQCTDALYRGPKKSTYKRTFIRNVSPITLQIATWPISHIYDEPRSRSKKLWDNIRWAVKWPIACYVLNNLVGIPGLAATGTIVNHGNYDPFPYRYWGSCKVSRNMLEEGTPSSGANLYAARNNRILEPKYLCIVGDEQFGRRKLVSEWKNDLENQSHHGKCPEYLFIAYTTEHFNHSSGPDMQALHAIATTATRSAGLIAYWVGASCMQRENVEDDVFRISDVVRGAHSMAIVIGPGARDVQGQSSTKSMLQHWGERLWTLPEALLISSKRPISVYRRGYQEPLLVPKNQFAAMAWADSTMTRELIDHYEGNLTLTRLELVTIAIQCLFARQRGEYLPGDHSYALMGLLRIRPKIDATDTQFQAFARLSLANDSDMLLERLMCISPAHPAQHWSSVSDAYGINVWDIYPACQIAGVCSDDTVLVDGAFGATIHWDKFQKVANTRRKRSWKRLAIQAMLHGAPHYFVIGMVLFRAGWDISNILGDIKLLTSNGLKTKGKHWALFFESIGIILIATACCVFVSSPYLTRLLYGGRFWGTQAFLFGFEGYLDIETIESQIFGHRMGRLRWSLYGSSLSRHRKNDFGESIGVDPTTDPLTRQKAEHALTNTISDSMRIFTLVDTNTMTVTMFEAVKPPVVVLLCGAEGGMQRAIACSYDWTTGTCYRETVLRMETPVLEKMSRVERFRFGMNRAS